ncbi:MAG TPA: hypothetical protein VH120_21035, partial [Gemmataceae bacterium]|nr:hypothetical protein [Gemmataceae bacterium]
MRRTISSAFCLMLVATACVSRPAAAADPVSEPLVKRVRDALDRGIDFLRRTERGRGHWETDVYDASFRTGGPSCLAVLALLNSGVRPEDPTVQRGLDYIRKLDLVDTYVVGLQTMVLAEAGDSKDLQRIQRNVDWLIAARVVRGGQLQGWGYRQEQGWVDNSNSQYALLGLYAGNQAGAHIEPAIWESIFQYYKTTQKPDGGWIYAPNQDG